MEDDLAAKVGESRKGTRLEVGGEGKRGVTFLVIEGLEFTG